MKRIIKFALSLNNLRKIINIKELYGFAHANLNFQVVDRIQAKRILVLSPHPDDDIFGAGGTLARFAQNGVEITVLYLFDGSGGTKTGKKDPGLIKKRREEAEKAAKILKFSRIIFWKNKDGSFLTNKTNIEKLKKIVTQINPEMIFLPHLFDNHPDHSAVNELFYKYLKDNRFVGEIWGYEIWSPTFINRLIDISKVWGIKEKAILAHRTQLSCRDYLGAIKGLNSFRAKSLDKGNLAEGFLYLSREAYLKIHQKLIQ